jgi:serine/threonine protein kinase
MLDRKCVDAYLRETHSASDDAVGLAQEFVRDGLLTSFQAQSLLQGQGGLFFGKYRVLERISRGGTCRVFLGEHVVTRRLVALKVLFPDLNEDIGAILRLRREAMATAAIDHPSFVQLYDVECDADPPFIVLEYVPGPSLEELVRAEGPLDFARAVNYAQQTAEGLQFAHEAGWMHRDLKPSNLLLDGAGAVKILDFGLARSLVEELDNLTGRYDSKDILGTADYLAPEQGADCHAVDARADIYSLGATLYFLLTGQAPFPKGTPAQKILSHQLREPPDLCVLRPNINIGLAAIVKKMMAKQPSDRYQTPREVVQALASPWMPRPQSGALEWTRPVSELPALVMSDPRTESLRGGAISDSGSVSSSIVIAPWAPDPPKGLEPTAC